MSSASRLGAFSEDEREQIVQWYYEHGRSLSAVGDAWRRHYADDGRPPPDKEQTWRVLQRYEREHGGGTGRRRGRRMISDAHAAAILKAFEDNPGCSVQQLAKLMPFAVTAATVRQLLESCDISAYAATSEELGEDAVRVTRSASARTGHNARVAELETELENTRTELHCTLGWYEKNIEFYKAEIRTYRISQRLLASKYESLRRVAMKHHKKAVIARRYPKHAVLERQATKLLPYEPEDAGESATTGEYAGDYAQHEFDPAQQEQQQHYHEYWAADVKPDVAAYTPSHKSRRRSSRKATKRRATADFIPPAWQNAGEPGADGECNVCRKCDKTFATASLAMCHELQCNGPKAKGAKKRAGGKEPAVAKRCAHCATEFGDKHELTTHVRTSCTVLRAQGVYDQHMCDTCSRTFANASRLATHKRKDECGDVYSTNPRAGLMCFACDKGKRVRGSRLDYVNHCAKVHGIPAKVDSVDFDNEVLFENWRLAVEDEGNFRFLITTNVADWADPVVKSYRCTYSGPNVPTWRRPGAPPKNPTRREYILVPKMGTECPAFLRAKIHKTTGKVEASFCLTHAGHKCDTVLKERFVAPQVEQYIADLLESGRFTPYDVDGVVQAVIGAKSKLSNAAERINGRTCRNVIAKVQKPEWKKRRRPVFFGPLYANMLSDDVSVAPPSAPQSAPPTQVVQQQAAAPAMLLPAQQQHQLAQQAHAQQVAGMQPQMAMQMNMPNSVLQSAMGLYGW